MTLKFCANLSFMFKESSSLVQRYHDASNAGFRAVECAFPYDYSPYYVASALKSAKVQQILINVYPGDLSKGELGFAAIPGKELQFSESLHLAIQYARLLKCSRIHIMSGVVDQITEENLKVYEKNLLYAHSLLEKEDMVGLIEPINPKIVPNYFMNSFEQALALVKVTNSPHIKIMMDLFHLQQLNGDLTKKIKELLPYVGHIQVAQVPHRHEPDSPGEISYPYVFHLLEELGYDGWIGLEYSPARSTVSGLKWIKEYGYAL